MKFSVEDGPPMAVYLDGKLIFAPQTADDETGIVTAPLITAEGKVVFDFGRDDYAIVERRGAVVFRRHRATSDYDYPALAKDNPFRVETARPGELSPEWNVPVRWIRPIAKRPVFRRKGDGPHWQYLTPMTHAAISVGLEYRLFPNELINDRMEGEAPEGATLVATALVRDDVPPEMKHIFHCGRPWDRDDGKGYWVELELAIGGLFPKDVTAITREIARGC